MVKTLAEDEVEVELDVRCGGGGRDVSGGSRGVLM